MTEPIQVPISESETNPSEAPQISSPAVSMKKSTGYKGIGVKVVQKSEIPKDMMTLI
jgi:hypothetical protein